MVSFGCPGHVSRLVRLLNTDLRLRDVVAAIVVLRFRSDRILRKARPP